MLQLSSVARRALASTGVVVLSLAVSSGTAFAASDKSGGQSPSDHQTSAQQGSYTSPQPASSADNSGHGANTGGPYSSTRDGSPSANGNGGGGANGKPCAGCVGKADNKNPKGQQPGGSDHNAGYECDTNHGIGRGNPAHTGCTPASASVSASTGGTSAANGSATSRSGSSSATDPAVRGSSTATDPGCTAAMTADRNGDGVIDSRDCTPVTSSTCTATMTGASSSACTTAVSASPTATRSGTQVLGEVLVRHGAATDPGQGGVHVLGAGLVRGITTLGGGAFAFTGSHITTMIGAALLALAFGLALVRTARRTEATD